MQGSSPKRLKGVIIGGGFAGLATARGIGNQHDVTVVDPRDYFEYTPGILKALVNHEHYKHISTPFDKVTGEHPMHVRGLAMEIRPYSQNTTKDSTISARRRVHSGSQSTKLIE